MAIEFNNNVILRQAVRQGSESDRQSASSAAFLKGECIYTTDTKRLFIGTGDAATITGNKYLGSKTFDGRVNHNKEYVSYNNGAAGSDGYNGDMLWDKEDNSLVIFDKDVAEGYRRLKQYTIDNDTIIESNGVLKVNAQGLDITPAIKSPDLVNNTATGEVLLKMPIKLDSVELRGNATTLKLPKNLTFGSNSFIFHTLAESSGAKSEYRLGLRKTVENSYEVYLLNDNTSTGGVSFDENFTINDNGSVSLNENITNIVSLKGKGSSHGVSLTAFGMVEADKNGLYARVIQDGNNYALCFSTLPDGGSEPVVKDNHGILKTLSKPIMLCWNGLGEGKVDARMQFAINGNSFCVKKFLTPIGENTPNLPFTSEESNPEKDGGDFFEKQSGENLVAWNNSFYVLGKNNYGNFATGAEGYEEAIEYNELALKKACFTPLKQNNILKDEIIFDNNLEKAEAFEQPTSLLFWWYENEDGTFYYTDASTGNDQTLTRILVNGVDIINGGVNEGIYISIQEDGKKRHLLYDTGAAVKGASELVLDCNGMLVRKNIREALIGDGSRSFEISLPENAQAFTVDSEGLLERLETTEEVVNINDYKDKNAFIVRTGEGGYEYETKDLEQENKFEDGLTNVYFIGEQNAKPYREGLHVLNENYFGISKISGVVSKTYKGVLGEDGRPKSVKVREEEITDKVIFYKINGIRSNSAVLADIANQTRFVKAVGEKELYIDTENVDNIYKEGVENVACEDGNIYYLSSVFAKMRLHPANKIYMMKDEETTAEMTEVYIYSDFLTPDAKGNILLFFPKGKSSAGSGKSFEYEGKYYEWTQGKTTKTDTATTPIWFDYRIIGEMIDDTYVVEFSPDCVTYKFAPENSHLCLGTYSDTTVVVHNDSDLQMLSYLSMPYEFALGYREEVSRSADGFTIPENFGKLYYDARDSKDEGELEVDQTSTCLSLKVESYSQKYNIGVPAGYEIKQYNIGNSYFNPIGVSPFDRPTVLNDVYVDDPAKKESVDETLGEQESISSSSTSVVLELNNHTDETIGVFYANSFDKLKVLYNVDGEENTTDTNVEHIGEYTVQNEVKKLALPSFVKDETVGASEAFSPSENEVACRIAANTSVIVEVPLGGDDNGKVFAMRICGVPLNNDTDKYFLMRLVGYRS